jgi:hypothetical protein
MTLNTDDYYTIGHAHFASGKPAQDRARSFTQGGFACAVVSDGCSSGGDTDIGATLLTLSTTKAARDITNWATPLDVASEPGRISRLISGEQQLALRSSHDRLGVSQNDLLATCVYAFIGPAGGFISVQGDGVIALKYSHGIRMHRFDWTKNAPFYPCYLESDVQRYLDVIHGGSIESAVMTHSSLFRSNLGTFRDPNLSHYPFERGRHGYLLPLSAEELAPLEFIAVFTDGICQIGKLPTGEYLLDWREAVTMMMDFKQPAGVFAKRRMMRAMKDLHKEGKGPIDDISYAVIHISHDEPYQGFEPEGAL